MALLFQCDEYTRKLMTHLWLDKSYLFIIFWLKIVLQLDLPPKWKLYATHWI